MESTKQPIDSQDVLNGPTLAKDRGTAVEETSDAKDTASNFEEVAAERDRLLLDRAELQDLMKRRQAEFDNFRKRSERDRADILEYANRETVRGLLPILDDFERAFKTESADKEYSRGMELIYQRLAEALKKQGLEPITSIGLPFDPNIHHAVDRAEAEGVEEDTILEEYQKGYNFRGKPLRPAMVKVAVRKS